MQEKRIFDLEERFIEFVLMVDEIVEALPTTKLGNYLAGQMIRSGTAPALNYGEAMGAESRKDFIHKMKVILKELRETFVCIKIIKKKNWITPVSKIETVFNENNELIAISVKSIQTAKSNLTK
jgi:four helix bundle protein